MVEQYKAGDTSIMTNRVHSVMSVIRDTSHPDNELLRNIYSSNRRVMNGYPEMRVYSDNDIRIINAFPSDIGSIEFDGNEYRMLDGQSITGANAIGIRRGTDLVFTSHEGSTLDAARAPIMEARKSLWVRNHCEPSAIDGIAGEEYDDVAEVMAQINLLGKNSDLDITYIGRDNAIVIKMHNHVTDIEEIYSLEIGGIRNSDIEVFEAKGLTPFIVVNEGCTINSLRSHIKENIIGGDTLTRDVTEEDIERRSEQLNKIKVAMGIIAKYGFIQGGKLRLPIGWNSADLLAV